MNPTLLIALAGLVLALPSSAVAVRDLMDARVGLRPPVVPQRFARAAPVADSTMPPPPTATSVRATSARAGTPLSIPRRLLSMLIDAYSSLLVAYGLALAISDESYRETYGEPTEGALGFMMLATAGAMALWNSWSGRSIGKLVVGGRLVRLGDPTGGVSFLRALGRLALTFIPFGFWLVLGPSRRTAYDRLSDTEVILVR